VRADCGERALTFLEQGGRFDALVTDYAMPGLTQKSVSSTTEWR
jgi:CheY-like chemotaxis protein